MQRNSSSEFKTAVISGFAYNFLTFDPLPNAEITLLDDPTIKVFTDKNGEYKFDYPIGKEITLVCKKEGFTTTQTFTGIVPEHGFKGAKKIPFQVISNVSFGWFATAMGVTVEKDKCQIAGTVTAFGKTYYDLPHGLPGIQIELYPEGGDKRVETRVFYFDICTWGPLIDKTWPLTRTLTETSEDGGFLIPNLPEGNYQIVAKDRDEQALGPSIKVKAGKNAFVNLSPPYGPAATKEMKLEKKTCTDRFFKPVSATGVLGGLAVAVGGPVGVTVFAAGTALCGGPTVIKALKRG